MRNIQDDACPGRKITNYHKSKKRHVNKFSDYHITLTKIDYHFYTYKIFFVYFPQLIFKHLKLNKAFDV